MKVSDYHFLSLLLPVTLGAQTVVPVDPNCCGNDPEGTVLEIRQTTSPEIVNARRAMAAANGYQSAGVEKAEGQVEIKIAKKSFLAGSEFLVGANGFVILPRGSTVTPSRSIQILTEPPAKKELQSWSDFQHSNRSTLRLLPITEEMLNGDEDALKTFNQKIAALKNGGIAYVTTLDGNPVSLPGIKPLTAK